MHPPMIEPGSRDIATFPAEFYLVYEPTREGSIKEIEHVRIRKKGDQSYERIESVPRMVKHGGVEWEAFKPYYDHWKKGLEAPIDGTPLSAWPGATPGLVKALEPFHIRSVEDFAKINDDVMSRLSIPRIRQMRSDALAYLDAQKNMAGVAGELAALRDKCEHLEALLAEATEQKKRGRPPKGTNEPAIHRQ